MTRRIFSKWYVMVVILLMTSLTLDSCQRYRYKKMIKKRRTGHNSKKRHKGTYQKKLNKKATITNSKYVIENRRNYRRRPWYGI